MICKYCGATMQQWEELDEPLTWACDCGAEVWLESNDAGEIEEHWESWEDINEYEAE